MFRPTLDLARAGPKYHRSIFWAMGRGWKADDSDVMSGFGRDGGVANGSFEEAATEVWDVVAHDLARQIGHRTKRACPGSLPVPKPPW